MIEEYGVVRETSAGSVAVEVTIPGECEKCEAHDACRRNGGIIHASVGNQGELSQRLAVGQAVKLRVQGTSLLGATAVVYGIPLLGLFAGLVLGYVLFMQHGEDIAAAVGALCGLIALALSGLVVRALDKRLSRRLNYDLEPVSVGPHREPGTGWIGHTQGDCGSQ